MRPHKVILCVDDNEIALSIRKFLLETKGYVVLTANGSEEAIDIFRKGGVDLVLTELVMPNIDGNQLVRILKAIKSVPMIITSGVVKSYDRALNADAFLPKGMSVEDLLERALNADAFLPKGTSVEDLLERVRIMVRCKRGPKPATKHNPG